MPSETKERTHRVIVGDCLDVLRGMDPQSVDLVFTSPPYGSQRSYGIEFVKDDSEWVEFCVHRFEACLRVCHGLVAWVVEGYTHQGTFHPLPELLTARLYGLGVNLRSRAIYKRYGIMGGNPDAFARHHEIIVCASKHGGRLPFADPKAMGHPPKCKPGGRPSHRQRDGRRVKGSYTPPTVCKASDVIDCGAVGGGNIGSKAAHGSEAPFPEQLAERFIRSYCPPGGVVLDPFGGSGTTAAVAHKTGRDSVSIDVRESQAGLMERRLAQVGASPEVLITNGARS